MPETVRREYTAQSKSQSFNKMGPKTGKKGKGRWATDANTRGNKVGKFEQVTGANTKLGSLKRK